MKKHAARRKIVIGLTGMFGSGKTTAAKFFKSFGAKVIDADKIAHTYLARGTLAYKRLLACFGPEILRSDKEIDRLKLGTLVFNDRKKLKQLNRIMLPFICRDINRRVASAGYGVIVLDAPLLLESGLGKITDYLVVVVCARELLINRVKKTRSISRDAVLKRIRNQIPLRDKIKAADFIIDNNSTLKRVKDQVRGLMNKLPVFLRK